MLNFHYKDLELQASMLKTMINSLPDIVFCKDVNLKYTLCNKYMADIFGKKVDDMIGKEDAEALGIPAEIVAAGIAADRDVLRGQPQVTYEEWLPCADGVRRLYEIVKVPLVLDKVVVGVMGIGRDITERKTMESELAFKTSKLQMILDSIPDMLFCKDTNFRYTQCNKHFENFIGVSETELIGKKDKDGKWLTPSQIERIFAIESTVMGEDRILAFEECIMAPLTGKTCYFETVKAPLKQGGVVVGMLGIARNITQRKAMEEEVQAASRAKSAFLANMSHEIRTPLNVVIGLTDLVLEDSLMPPTVSENLIKISSAGSTLLSIVNDLLDFSKIESGKLELTPIEYHISSMLNDVITIVTTRLGEKPVTFKLNINDDLPSKLFGDDLRVKQIFNNLLSNALKYTHRGSIELSVSCSREGSGGWWMEIAVADTGIGIREADIKKLFSDYNQVDTRANRNIEGTGLGLSITKRLTEMMGGTISVTSEYGKGSCFYVKIKQGFASDEPIGHAIAENLRNFRYADNKRSVTKKLVRLNLENAKVLVVDDMQTNLDVAAGLLRKYRMQVDCLTSGREAVERIQRGEPVYNAVFMDHMMPGMDGLETSAAIRGIGSEYAKKVPIIALTANAIQGTNNLFFEHGFQAFISKPIDIMELDTVVRKWVRDNLPDAAVVQPVVTAPVDETETINIPGVDAEAVLSLYDGDMEIYMEILRSFVLNSVDVLKKMSTVTQETLPSYAINVHGLKGICANIGAETLRAKALELETLAKAGDLTGVLTRNDKVISDTKNLVSAIKAWLERPSFTQPQSLP